MDNRPLHPNLARLAAQYDEILRRYSVGEIDSAAASAQIVDLQARDDEGIIWTIDPQTGAFKRRTRDGRWVVDPNPPTSGVATLTAHDLSRDPRLFNPDSRISFDQASVEQQGLRGAVKGRVGVPQGDVPSRSRSRRWLVVLAVLTALVTAGTVLAGGDRDSAPTEVPAPTQPQDTGPTDAGGVGQPGMPTG